MKAVKDRVQDQLDLDVSPYSHKNETSGGGVDVLLV